MASVEEVLDKFGERVTRLAKINLGAFRVVDGKRRRTDNTGTLRNSLEFETKAAASGNSFEFSLSMEDYGKFVDSGRDGTKKRNRSKGILKSRNRGVGIPRSKLRQWIRQKPIRVRDLTTGELVRRTPARTKSQMFLINRKIREQGTPATLFLSEPFEEEFKSLPDEVVEAYGLEVEQFLTFALKK